MSSMFDALGGKIHNPFTEVRLIGRAHAKYYGPVYSWSDALWIYYNNEPVEVVHLHGNQYEERH